MNNHSHNSAGTSNAMDNKRKQLFESNTNDTKPTLKKTKPNEQPTGETNDDNFFDTECSADLPDYTSIFGTDTKELITTDGCYSKTFDFEKFVIEQVAFEGLDGITLQAYWIRCEEFFQNIHTNFRLQKLMWETIVHANDIHFYHLEQSRPNLVPNDSDNSLENDTGETPPEDIYPIHPVKDANVRGSCQFYATRVNITDIVRQLTFKEALIFGNHLVLVATQDLRNAVLFDNHADPTTELSDLQYCLLERIGRARRAGESTSNLILCADFKDAKTLFYNRKLLQQAGLIRKQFYLKFHSQGSNLLFLPRFHNERRSRAQIMIEQIVEVLRTRPNYSLEYREAKQIFGNVEVLAKLIKMPELHHFVRTQLIFPYKAIYPDAPPSAYMLKNNRERTVRMMQLIDPKLNVVSSWLNEEELQESDEPLAVSPNYYLKSNAQKLIYDLVAQSGDEGITKTKLMEKVGLDFYMFRHHIELMQKSNVFCSVECDEGRQRVTRYFIPSQKTDSPPPINEDRMAIASFLSNVLNIDAEHLLGSEHRNVQMLVKPFECNADADRPIKSLNLREILTTINNNDNNGPEQLYKALESMDRHRDEMVYTKVRNAGEHIACQPAIVYDLIDVKSQLLHIEPQHHQHGEEQMDEHVTLYQRPTMLVFPFIRSYSLRDVRERLPKFSGLETKDASSSKAFHSDNFPFQFTTNGSYLSCKTSMRKKRKPDTVADSELLKKQRLAATPSTSQSHLEPPAHAPCEHPAVANFHRSLIYMGPYPRIIHRQKTDLFELTVSESTPPAQFGDFARVREPLRPRIIKYLNQIKAILQRDHIILHMPKLTRIIEQIDNTQYQIDTHSMHRIYAKLVASRDLKFYRAHIANAHVFKALTIVCLPTIGFGNALIQSSIENLKLNFTSYASRKMNESGRRGTRLFRKEQKPLVKAKKKCLYKRQYIKKYGIVPKFAKTRLLHEYLYHLAYELRETKVEAFVDDEDAYEHPVYAADKNWKMFIPPFAAYEGYAHGWLLTSDVLVHMPLSVFVQIHTLTYDIPHLDDYLHDPIKQHYLLQHLPAKIQDGLFYKRKYISSLNETLTRLCHIGLLQFGDQKTHNKDQQYVYVNRNASLRNTTTSAPGYHQTEVKEYAELRYHFATSKDIAAYWHNMFNICIYTKLGLRIPVAGTYITIENVKWKPSMVGALKAKRSHEAPEQDQGKIPGDGRGAAGLDAGLWAHLHRNWIWKNQSKGTTVTTTTVTRIEPAAPRKLKQKRANKVPLPVPLASARGRKKLLRRVELPKKSKGKQRPLTTAAAAHVGKRLRLAWTKEEDKVLRLCKIVSTYLCRNNAKLNVPGVVLASVMHYLCPRSAEKNIVMLLRRQMYIFGPQTVRELLDEMIDVLDRYPLIDRYFAQVISGGEKKTSTSIKQLSCAFVFLTLYIYDHQEEMKEVFQTKMFKYQYGKDIFAINENQNKQKELTALIEKKLQLGRGKLDEGLDFDTIFSNSYVQLFIKEVLGEKCVEKIDQFGPSTAICPSQNEDVDTTSQQLVIEKCEPIKELEMFCYHFYKRPTTLEDIHADAIKSIVHSAININPKESLQWAYQIFKALQHYPERLLRKTINELRQNRFISINSTYRRRHCEKQVSAVVCTTPYEFSIFYKLAHSSSYPARLFIESRDFVADVEEQLLKASADVEDARIPLRFHAHALSELWVFADLSLALQLDEDVFAMDNRILYDARIMERVRNQYKRLVRKLDRSNLEDTDEWDSSDVSESKSRTKVIETLVLAFISSSQLNDNCTDYPYFTREILTSDEDKIIRNEQSAVANTAETCTIVNRPLLKKEEARTILPLEQLIENTRNGADPGILPILTMECYLREMDEPLVESIAEYVKTSYPDASICANNAQVVERLHAFEQVQRVKCNELLEKMKIRAGNVDVQTPSRQQLSHAFRKLGATNEDVDYAKSLMKFVNRKGVLGSNITDLKRTFGEPKGNLALSHFLQLFVYFNIFIRVGTCEFIYVHHRFINSWLIASCVVRDQDRMDLGEQIQGTSGDKVTVHSHEEVKIRMSPWIRIDNSFDVNTFEKWITTIMSSCLIKPLQPLISLIAHCYFLKPTDVYTLVECLEEVDCLKLVRIREDATMQTLNYRIEGADETDKFEDIYVQVNKTAAINCGILLKEIQNLKTEV